MVIDHLYLVWEAEMNNHICAQGTTETDNQHEYLWLME